MTETIVDTITTVDTPAPQPTQTGLTIQDLTLALQIINLSATRGAFKGDEMSTVGGLHDRIFKFLDSVGAITHNPAPSADTAPAVPK